MKAPNNDLPKEIWMHRNDDGSLDLSVFMRSKSRDTDICYVQIDKVEKEASDIEGGMIDIIIGQYDDADKANELIQELIDELRYVHGALFQANNNGSINLHAVWEQTGKLLAKIKESTDE